MPKAEASSSTYQTARAHGLNMCAHQGSTCAQPPVKDIKNTHVSKISISITITSPNGIKISF